MITPPSSQSRQTAISHRLRSRIRQRHGFTLIEMLVVIGIIAILFALVSISLSGLIGSSKERATQATIRKLHGMVQARLEAIDRAMQPNRANSFRVQVQNVKNNLMGAPYSLTPDAAEQLARVLVRKQLELESLPQSYSEDPDISPAAGHDPATESAEMLYHVLTEKSLFDIPAASTDAFSGSEIGDTDGDGRLEFLDAWGQPLRFYRWPTRLIRPHGSKAAATFDATEQYQATSAAQVRDVLMPHIPEEMLYVDPVDPFGLVRSRYNPADNMETDYHTPGTWHGALIVSAGPDGVLGLNEPVDRTATRGHLARPTADVLGTGASTPRDLDPLYDNVTNRQKSTDAK